MRVLLVERPHVARLTDLPCPEPGPDEVLVRVGAAGICGSDVELLRGERPAPYVRYPIVPGHEWSGTVVEVGAGAQGVRAGDVVVAEGFRYCGRCERCREGRTNLCQAGYAETGFTHPGAFAEYLTVPARLVHVLPPGTRAEDAALLEPAACVANALLGLDLRPGLAIAVVGGGTLGLLAVSMLRLTSPARLALVDVRHDRLELGREMAVDEVCDASSGDLKKEMGDRFDLVFEATGHPSGAATALALARRGGTVVLEGIAGRPAPIDADSIPLRQLRVQGVFGASSTAWSWAVDLFAHGRLRTAELVTHRYPLVKFDAAFSTLQDPGARAVKVLFVPEEGG